MRQELIEDGLSRLPVAKREMEVTNQSQNLWIARCDGTCTLEPDRAILERTTISRDTGEAKVAVDIRRVAFHDGLVQFDGRDDTSSRFVEAGQIKRNADRHGVPQTLVWPLDQQCHCLWLWRFGVLLVGGGERILDCHSRSIESSDYRLKFVA